jgi:AcrR family transcriptional regulator
MSAGMPPATAVPTEAEIEELLAAPLGLRERKKLKTRRAIRAAAFRLFNEQGYENTTVDRIAADADVSPSTFFRYFPTKEDLITTDDYDPLMESALRGRPVDEPLLESVREAILPALRSIMIMEREEMLLRMRLLRDNPAIRSRSATEMSRTRDALVGILVEQRGPTTDLLALRAPVSAILAACNEAIEDWADHDGVEEITDVVERALDSVVAAFRS